VLNQNLTYTITVTNLGPATANDVQVVDTLPASVDFVSATPSQGNCVQMATLVTCALGTLLDQSMAVVTIVVVPRQVGPLENTAVTSSEDSDTEETDDSTVVGRPTPTAAPVIPSAASPWALVLIASLFLVVLFSLRRNNGR